MEISFHVFFFDVSTTCVQKIIYCFSITILRPNTHLYNCSYNVSVRSYNVSVNLQFDHISIPNKYIKALCTNCELLYIALKFIASLHLRRYVSLNKYLEFQISRGPKLFYWWNRSIDYPQISRSVRNNQDPSLDF